MGDPIGLIGSGQGGGIAPRGQAGATGAGGEASGFKDLLRENLLRVNELEQDATRAIEDLSAGRRSDIEGVALAAEKADTAFKALQAVRNKVLEAYEEIKQMRA